jgi:hypothetical protein
MPESYSQCAHSMDNVASRASKAEASRISPTHTDIQNNYKPAPVSADAATRCTDEEFWKRPCEPTLMGIPDELRDHIFDYVLSFHKSPQANWPRQQRLALDQYQHAYALLSVSRKCQWQALEALLRNNLIICVRIRALGWTSFTEFFKDPVRTLLPCIPWRSAAFIESSNVGACIGIAIRTPGSPHVPKTAVTRTFFLPFALRTVACIASHVFNVHPSIHLVNLIIRPGCSSQNHPSAKEDMVQIFGWLQGFVKLATEERLADWSSFVVPNGYPFTQYRHISTALRTFDSILLDLISAQEHGR